MGRETMIKGHKLFGASIGRGPRPSRRRLLQGGLAIGTLALGGRAAPRSMPTMRTCRRSASRSAGGAGDGPAADRARGSRSANGVLAPACAAPTPIAISAAFASILRSYEGGWPRRCG